MLAPFVLYVAKYSKRLNKEAKEDYIILAGLCKIKPVFCKREDKFLRISAMSAGVIDWVDEDSQSTDEDFSKMIHVDALYN